jgi:hypothetical protein
MEELFPGLIEDLKNSGVPESDPAADIRYAAKCGWLPRFASPLRLLQPTRHVIEWYIRDRARAIPSVEFQERTRVTGLRSSSGSVTGVNILDEATETSSIIDADLVVDASGRGSRAPRWLADLGLNPPEETVVDARWGYATTYVKAPADWEPGYQALYVGPTVSGDGPGATRGGAMWRQEDEQWVITAQGCAGDYPPADLGGFKDFMGSFAVADFNELIDRGEIVAPLEAWRNTANRLRDYAHSTTMPENFIALGDATASFNPIYAQGMAASAFGARLLRSVLAESAETKGLTGFAPTFQEQLDHAVIQPCWSFSVGADHFIPGALANGIPVPQVDVNPEAEFFERVLALATEDRDVTLKWWETILLVRGPEWLAEDGLLQRVQAEWERLGNHSRV